MCFEVRSKIIFVSRDNGYINMMRGAKDGYFFLKFNESDRVDWWVHEIY